MTQNEPLLIDVPFLPASLKFLSELMFSAFVLMIRLCHTGQYSFSFGFIPFMLIIPFLQASFHVLHEIGAAGDAPENTIVGFLDVFLQV